MNLQTESDTIQDVNETEGSPAEDSLLKLVSSKILENRSVVLMRAQWLYVLYSVSKWLLGLSLILTVSVFTYTAFYLTVMPTEVITGAEDERPSDSLSCLDSSRRCQLPVRGLS